MRKSGIVEKYVQLVQDMYEGSETVVRCAVGTTESFKVTVGLHQGSALSPFLFAVIMDRLTDEVRREPSWTMLFADDIVICEETREEVERRLESRKYALERRGMKVSRSKTEYLCINGGNDDKTVKMEDTTQTTMLCRAHAGPARAAVGDPYRFCRRRCGGPVWAYRTSFMWFKRGRQQRQTSTAWSSG